MQMHRKPMIPGILMVIPVLACFLLAACGSSSSSPADTSPINIGFVGPLTGRNAVLGKWATYSLQLAVEQTNANGGIHGRQINLIKLDDGSDTTQTVNDVQKLITEDKIVACFCGPQSGNTLAAEPLLTRNKIVQITDGLALNLTAQSSPYIFRNTPAGPAFENTLITYLVKQKSFTSFAIITDTTDYGKGEAQYQTDQLQTYGFTPLTTQRYNATDTDFTGQLNAIIALHPQVLLFGGSEVASGLIAKQARALGFTGQLAWYAHIYNHCNSRYCQRDDLC
jgi:branched-chain amino acid transport system substrate-binding protein